MVSNFLNHHQLTLCNAFKRNCDEFYFIATSPISGERLKLGYADMNRAYDFVVRTYDKSTSKERLRQILTECDAVIFGACSDKYIEFRIKQGKLSFLASERFFKKGVWRRFYPPVKKQVANRTVRFAGDNYYVLCASAFLSWDLSLMGFPAEKCFKWGYFPQVEHFEIYPERNNEKLRILWAGRMIDWKRADTALKACQSLKKSGVDFRLSFIGDGNCAAELKELSVRLGLEDNVVFLGSMPPEKVREEMLASDIFLFTSNFREGWGAVLNEAMSCGCAVLASSGAGSVPYLIDDNKNAVIYKYNSQKDFNNKLLMLANDKSLRRKLGECAVNTINNEYSAELAVERFLDFVRSNGKIAFEKGPMSRAEIIKNNWYK